MSTKPIQVLAADDSGVARNMHSQLIESQPDMDGIQATWLVSSKVSLGGVIMVTSEERINFLQKAMVAGAHGSAPKVASAERWLPSHWRCPCASSPENLSSGRSIVDLLPHIEALDSKLIHQVVGKHSSGVHVVARPPRTEQADAIKDRDVRTLVSSLSMLYDWVVLDTPPSYDERMMTVLDLADVYVVVLTPHLGALRNTRHFLEVAEKPGYSRDRIWFVLNRANSSSDLALNDVASVVLRN